jgi:alkaline phosphatase D
LLVRYEPERGGTAAAVEIEGNGPRDTDGTRCVALPAGGPPLVAGCAYRFEVSGADDRLPIGAGRFETAPESPAQAPERLAIGFFSCHQPFDAEGTPRPESEEMLAAARAFERHATKLVLTIGDQMYTDYPKSLSLFDESHFQRVAPPGRTSITACSAAEVRRLLQERHRSFWSHDGWRRLHADYACYPMLDDHELADNWGCDPEHDTAAWSEYRRGARAAYFDYQGSRVIDGSAPPDDFDFALEFGPAAVYALDLRSNRTVGADARLCSRNQERRLGEFLEAQRERDVLLIVLPVPAVHLPRWVARLGRLVTNGNEDFADRWSAAGHLDDRDRVLRMLHRHQRAHPRQRLVLVSGDIHLACAHRIEWEDGARPLLQFVSSGITHRVAARRQLLAKMSLLLNRRICTEDGDLAARVRVLRGESPFAANPYTGLNVGIVELERQAHDGYGVRLFVYGQRNGEPVCVYRSPRS